MKTTPLVLIGAFLAFSGSSHAAVIASDNFSYSVGEIAGQNGGTGWSGAWNGVAALTEVDDPGVPLGYSAPGLAVNGGDRALRVSGNNDNAVSRSLASQNANTIFVSFLVRTSGAFTSNDFGAFWFDNVATGTHLQAPNIGMKADGSGGLDFMSRLRLGNEVYSTASLANTSYLVVGRLSKSVAGPGSNYDRFALWVNPTTGEENTPDANAVVGSNISSFNQIGIRTANLSSGEAFFFDSFLVATSYQEAIGAVPEPGTMTLAGVGALLLLFGRRRIVRS